MRKTAILIVLLLVFNGLCFAKSTGNENRIIGSWQQTFVSEPDTWIFNNNGTMTMADMSSLKYVITGSKLAIYINFGGTESLIWFFDYQISTDGKTLILKKQSGYAADDVYFFTKR